MQNRKPDQHESQIRKLELLIQGQGKQQKILETLVKAVGQGPAPIQVQFSWPMDSELMQIVREIRDRLAGGSGLTESQEQELAGKLAGGTDPLQEAVEANQPQS